MFWFWIEILPVTVNSVSKDTSVGEIESTLATWHAVKIFFPLDSAKLQLSAEIVLPKHPDAGILSNN